MKKLDNLDQITIEEIRKEIENAVKMFKKEHKKCEKCYMEYDDREGMIICIKCNKKIG